MSLRTTTIILGKHYTRQALSINESKTQGNNPTKDGHHILIVTSNTFVCKTSHEPRLIVIDVEVIRAP